MKIKPVDIIKGIGPVNKKKLNDIGIFTTNDLIEKALKSKDRIKLFSDKNLSLGDLRKWAGYATLTLIKGIGEKNASLLNRANINNAGQLANQNAFSLSQLLGEIKPDKNEKIKTTSEETISAWIEESKTIVKELNPGISNNISLKKLNEIDAQMSDILFLNAWDELIKLGEFIQEQAYTETRKIQVNYANQLTVKKYSKADFNATLKNTDINSVSEMLLGAGESREKVDLFFQSIPDKTFTSPKVKNTKSNILHFPVFLNILGGYLIVTGKINNSKIARQNLHSKNEYETLEPYLLENNDIKLTREDFEKNKKEIKNIHNKSQIFKVDEIENELNEFIKNIYDSLKSLSFSELQMIAFKGTKTLDLFVEKHYSTLQQSWNYYNTYPNPNNHVFLTAIKISELMEHICISYGLINYFRFSFKNPELELKEDIENAVKLPLFSSFYFSNQNSISELIEKNNININKSVSTVGIIKYSKEWRESEKAGFTLQNGNDFIDVLLNNCDCKTQLPFENCFAEIKGILKEGSSGFYIEIGEKTDKSWMETMTDKFAGFYPCTYLFKTDQSIRFQKTAKELIKNYWR